MKRAVLTLVVLLVTAAIVTVLVAWTIALRTDSTSYATPRALSEERFAELWRRHALPDQPTPGTGTARVVDAPGARAFVISTPSPHAPNLITVAEFGWPIPSMGMRAFRVESNGTYDIWIEGAWQLGPSTTDPAVPLLPSWRGFALDLGFYALLLAILFVAPGTGRRFYRRSRQRCTRCGYPVPPSSTCPECGTPAR